MLRSDLCDYGVYIVVKRRITLENNVLNNGANEKLVCKNNAPFRSGISKINTISIDNAEDLDIAILVYNFLE